MSDRTGTVEWHGHTLNYWTDGRSLIVSKGVNGEKGTQRVFNTQIRPGTRNLPEYIIKVLDKEAKRFDKELAPRAPAAPLGPRQAAAKRRSDTRAKYEQWGVQTTESVPWTHWR